MFITNYLKLDDNSNTDLDTHILKTSITNHFSTIITVEKYNCIPIIKDHQSIERKRINWNCLNFLITNENWNRLCEINDIVTS